MDIKILYKINNSGKRVYVIKLAITPINLGRRLIITIKLTNPLVNDVKLPISPGTNDLTDINFVEDISFDFTNTELNVEELLEGGYIQRIVEDKYIKQVLSNIFNQILWYRRNCTWDNINENFGLLDSIMSSTFVFDGKYYSPLFIANPGELLGGRIRITDYKWIF
jgi:hypothetical protein